jgi:hypothetical protein
MSGPFAIAVKLVFEIVREEKQLEYGKDEEQFYGDDLPEGSSYNHGAESLSIKKTELFWQYRHARTPPFQGMK